MTETFDPQDVLARLDALESGLDISQLPLRALMNTLETNWQPDSGVLLQPKSIGADKLVDSVLAAPVVTVLPSNPQDGQAIDYLADATNGVVWRLKYRAASASGSKWEFVGGPPMYDAVDTNESTASATYVDLATVGPSITVPLAGDYIFDLSSQITTSTTSAAFAMASLKIGAAATVDNDAIQDQTPVAAAATRSMARRIKRNVSAASTVCKLQYRSSTGTATFGRRALQITPVRVG